MAEKLYYHGDIITMESEGDKDSAVLVKDGLIQQIFKEEVPEEILNDQALEKIDLKGKTLLPGFIDPHSHFSMMGPISKTVNLRQCESFKDIQTAIEEYIAAHKPEAGAEIMGFGYDHNFLKEFAHPTKEVLDQVSKTHPIYISHISSHMGVVNSAGLKALGIDENTVDKPGSKIGRSQDGKTPNGYLEENAWVPVQYKLFSYEHEALKDVIQSGQDVYLQNGITTAQDGATNAEYVALYKEIAEEGRLKIDVVAYETVAEVENNIQDNPELLKQYQNHFKIGGYKMFLDGSPQGKTAWLSQPYEGEAEYRGYPSLTDAQVIAYAEKAIKEKAQLITHCNGDQASEQLLNSYEQALENCGEKSSTLRPVMIHSQMVRDDQLDRMKKIGMIPSIFMAHTYYWGDVHLKNLGDARGRRISPAHSAFKRGLKVNFHQDSPVIQPNMLETIWCAVNRQTRSGQSIGPEERITVFQALQAVTINAAYAYFEEETKGTISEGKVADFVILDQNPLKINPEHIKNIQVLATIKAGVTQFQQ